MNGNALPEQAHYGSRLMAFPCLMPLLLSKALTFFFAYITVSLSVVSFKKKAIKFLLSLFKEIRKFQKLCYSVEHQVSALANRTNSGTGLLSFSGETAVFCGQMRRLRPTGSHVNMLTCKIS